MTKRFHALLTIVTLTLMGPGARAGEVYHHYFGSTHAHSCYSDGKSETPADHFRKAKAAGYDFYAVTDHALAKYKQFTAQSYETTKREAVDFTDDKFIGIVGFEFSENDGPGGKGHLTALNTAGYLDATGPKVTLSTFYDWLVTNQPTTVAASFNHPGKDTYNGYDYLTPARRDGITMFEMINGGKPHYEAFLAALNKGWRVAPIAALDAHGAWRITNESYRTGVLAPSLTRENIMQALHERRAYCTLDKNLRLTFSANGSIMGSVLSNPSSLSFRVDVLDPDIFDANDRITRIEIIGENGVLVAARSFSAHAASWSPTCVPAGKYYFAVVYSADKTDGPTAYSAPVWIEQQPVDKPAVKE